MALALLSVSDRTTRPVRVVTELGASLPTCWAAAGALLWIATSPVAGPMTLEQPTAAQAAIKSALYTGVAVLLVLPLVFGDAREGWVRQALASRPGRFLGDVSYGLFLVHVIVLAGGFSLFGLPQFRGNLFWVALAVWVLSVGVASLLYVAVERPLSRFRGVVGDHPRPAPGTSSAATTEQTASSART
jgi:peptidoglycan/LPS O-acetylase OafA/YrhL